MATSGGTPRGQRPPPLYRPRTSGMSAEDVFPGDGQSQGAGNDMCMPVAGLHLSTTLTPGSSRVNEGPVSSSQACFGGDPTAAFPTMDTFIPPGFYPELYSSYQNVVPYGGRTIRSDVCMMLFERTHEEVKYKESYLVSMIIGGASLTAAVLTVTPFIWHLRNSDDHCCQPLMADNLNCCFAIPQPSQPACCRTTEDLVVTALSNCTVAQSAVLARRAGVSIFSALAFCLLIMMSVLSFLIPGVLVSRERMRLLEFIFCPESHACKVRTLFWTLGMEQTLPRHRLALDAVRYLLMMLITSWLCTLCLSMARFFDKSIFCLVTEDKQYLLQEMANDIWFVGVLFCTSLTIVVVRGLWLQSEEELNYNFVFSYARRWKEDRNEKLRKAEERQRETEERWGLTPRQQREAHVDLLHREERSSA